LGAGDNPEKTAIAGTFNAHSIGISCTLFDRPATLTRKSKIRAIPAVSGSALEAMAETAANPLSLTDRTTLAIESGMTALAAKGVVIVGRGRRQFDVALAATLPASLGKICQGIYLPNCLLKKREAAEAAPPS
jgi:hypothetical protein